MPIVNTPTQAPADDLDKTGCVLMEAADIVDVRWRQHGYGYDGGPRCALGAISEICEVDYNLKEAAIERLGAFLGGSIQLWNDTPGRKAAEVSAAMRAAARTRP